MNKNIPMRAVLLFFIIMISAGCAPGGDAYSDDSEYKFGIPADCKIWLMADKGVETDGANRISVWRDQSGNGNDALQPVYAERPELVENFIHDKSSVYFDGNYFMSVTGSPLFTHGNDAGIAVFVVFRMEEIGTWQGIFSLVRDDNIKPFILHNMTDSLRFSFLVTPADIDSNYVNTDYGLEKFKIVSCLYSPDESLDMINLKVDGTVKNVMSRSFTSSPSTSMFIGKSPRNTSPPYIHGYIAELIMYDRGLSDVEIKKVECYLWDKYNINCEGCND